MAGPYQTNDGAMEPPGEGASRISTGQGGWQDIQSKILGGDFKKRVDIKWKSSGNSEEIPSKSNENIF